MLDHLPAFNAAMNATATVLLLVGRRQVKQGRIEDHKHTMLAATAVSALFLAGYLTYHFAVVPELGHTELRRTGAVKVLYYGMLISHVVLAAVNLPMVIVTLVLGLRRRDAAHRRWARVTWPVWVYVSITGVLIYVALYWWNPPPGLE